MPERIEMPDSLRTAVAQDMRPVKPLPPPWKRLLLFSPVMLGLLAMPWVYYQVRDTGDLGMILSWIPVAVQVFLAFGLLTIALREGVPGWRVPSSTIFVLVLIAYGLQIVVNLLIFMQAPMDGGGVGAWDMWMGCFRTETMLGIPILVVVAWMVSRAMPSRPIIAGFLAGTGAGVAGEASWRMICPYSDPGHVMMGHTGGILILGLTGFLLGYLWSVYRRPRAQG